MERGNTKNEILDAALQLFSVQGYDATSISQIADAVGIRKASLYSHFASKQAILDTLLDTALQQYEEHSVFAGKNWEKDPSGLPKNSDAAVKMVQGQLKYILHDPLIQRGRKMLVIEQFRNSRLAEIQTRQNYTDIMTYFTGMIRCLIDHGVLKDEDPQMMAAQFCLPITVWLQLCDREPEKEEEVMDLVEKHIRQFYRLYRK